MKNTKNKSQKILKYIKHHIQKVEINKINNINDIKNIKTKYLHKKTGIINIIINNIKQADNKKKKILGIYINKLKKNILKKIKKYTSKTKIIKTIKTTKDLTIINHKETQEIGSMHPIYLVQKKIVNIFKNIGFIIHEDTEIENDWNNFTALNIPKNHPARQMHDTFFINKKFDKLLRTHTSATQIKYMKKNNPPIRVVSSGKVYRNETLSNKSLCMFHQLEGFYINKNVSILELLKIIKYFIKNIFENKIKFRIRPSYFPFTQPSIEIDIAKQNNNSYYKWIEIMGGGIIDPKILDNVGINNKIFSGFAFGMGIERIVQILYNIKDIRTLYKNNINFLSQFKNHII